MCKLYALQTTMTKAYARKVIAVKAKEILKTESSGFGMSLNVNGVTRTWQCGESLTDSEGEDVTAGLDDELRMATLIMHGRTATSADKSVAHSHPRVTGLGPLMHNGVVSPISDEGWEKVHDLDTDYLAELASRDDLHNAASYLNGYAAVLWLKDDGSLVVQNQGANLRYKIQSEMVEFGTTMALCDGAKFEDMRCETLECRLSIIPLPPMGSRAKYYNANTDLGIRPERYYPKAQRENQAPEQASLLTSTNSDNGSHVRAGRTADEMGPNKKKKGRYVNWQEVSDGMLDDAYQQWLRGELA